MSSTDNVVSTVSRMLKSNLVYFPQHSIFSFPLEAPASSDAVDDVTFIPDTVARFRLVPAGLCTNWYCSPVQWHQLLQELDCKNYNNHVIDLLSSLDRTEVRVPLALISWVWNSSCFSGSRSRSSVLDAALCLDKLEDFKAAQISSFIHGHLRAVVADRIIWYKSDSPSIYQCRQIGRKYIPKSKSTKYAAVVKHLSSMNSWPTNVTHFLTCYKQYRLETSGSSSDIFSLASHGDVGLGLFMFVERLSCDRIVTTVLAKFAMAAIGLLGLLEVSLFLILTNCLFSIY